MKRSIFYVLSLLISLMILAACGSGGGSNSDPEEHPGAVIPHLTTSKSLASMGETVVKVAGEGNDLLTITIPKLPFGQSEDLVVEFRLIYNGTDPLPEISIDTDIEFDTAVTLEFRSDTLTENSYVFVYHGAAQDYFVPFEKNGNIYTAKLLHFSEYGFDETPASDSLEADIKAALLELNSYTGDGGLYALNRALVNDILTKINLLEQLEPALEHNYRAVLTAIIDRVVDTWLTKMERSQVPFWEGYCVHSEFKTFITLLVQTMTEVELMGARDISVRVQSEISYRMKAAAVEWQGMTPPGACDTGTLEKYINCGVKFATEMELSGVDSTVDIIKIIVEQLDSNNLFILENADCDNIDCLRYYLSKQGEMVLAGVEDRTQALQAKLSEIEEMIDNDSCDTGLWNFTVNYSNTDYGSGTITASDIIIDFDAVAGPGGTIIYAIADSTCSGDLYGCGDFAIYNDNIVTPGSKWISFDSMILIDTVNNIEGEMTSAEMDLGFTGLVCDGHIPDSFGPDSGVTTWTYSNSFSSWTLTLEPCAASGCE